MGTGDSSVLSEERLCEIEARHTASTPGPWRSFIEGRDHQAGSDFIQSSGDDIELLGATHADQDFIANAHQDVPELLAEVRRLKALVGRCGDG